MTVRAAGCLFITPEKKVLYLRRADTGQWAFVGGCIEAGETPCEAACRETLEEIGCLLEEKFCREWTHTCCDYGQGEVDFTTFIANANEEFTPILNEEHTAWCWAPWDCPPEPLHPGCAIALAKCSPEWTELHTAQAVADNRLCSPQKYENIWFFLVRVTGTEGAFRHEKKDDKGDVVMEEEVVWRDPSLYLNPEFLERCKGLPVILEHPPDETLDTKEYKKRNIGSLMVPHIRDVKDGSREVWAIARVLDEGAAAVMATKQLSTSPAVLWSDQDSNLAGTLENGTRFLIEGKPSLLDHLAICWQGVWDKGGDPIGVKRTATDSVIKGDSLMAMTPEELQKFLADQQKANARIDSALEGFTKLTESIMSRLDSVDDRFKKADQAKARKRVDSFEFSPRRKGESDEKYKSRHDSEERMLRMDMMEAGETEKTAADAAAKLRKDAEVNHMLKADDDDDKARKDDDDDEDKKSRKDDDDDDDKKRSRKDAKGEDDDDDDDDDDDKKSRKDDDDNDAKKKARKDDDDDDDKKSRKDDDDDDDDDSKRSRKDSTVVSMKDYEKLLARVDALAKPLTDAELNKVGMLQKRVDSIYVANGEKMPPLVAGDSFDIYQRKVLNDLKKHTSFKDAELSVIAVDSGSFAAAAEHILREAALAARAPANMKPGELRMLTRHDSGHTYNEWAGDTSWMSQFAGPARNYVKKFNVPENQR